MAILREIKRNNMKGLRFFICYKRIYLTLGSVIAGFYRILIRFFSRNSYFFYMRWKKQDSPFWAAIEDSACLIFDKSFSKRLPVLSSWKSVWSCLKLNEVQSCQWNHVKLWDLIAPIFDYCAFSMLWFHPTTMCCDCESCSNSNEAISNSKMIAMVKSVATRFDHLSWRWKPSEINSSMDIDFPSALME